MRLPGLRSIHINQKGFTFVELMIAFAITGIIAAAATGAIFQLFSSSTRSNNQIMAVRQVQNAGYWISRDAQMAQGIVTPIAPEFLRVNWTDWDGTQYAVTYSIVSGKLQRSETRTVGGIPQPTTDSFVAEYINAAGSSCQYVANVLSVTIKSEVGGGSQQSSETRLYEVRPRPSA
ncbi:MAG: prepilin-type N-terminal cleavage/methylation domain-containing protein [Dehalococcoidales bacterium]|nr:prepilin-type N-terminal cleavage/methylation domain-containing protein [Dehalococcoidales bacterium]